MKSLFVLLITGLMIGPLASINASEQRHIHLNGEHLIEENILLLDQISGGKVGDGYYWLNLQTGQWGYEGNEQVQGVLVTVANQANSEQQVSSSNSYSRSANAYNDWEGVSSSGSVTSGQIDGKNCTYVSVAGTTMRSCD